MLVVVRRGIMTALHGCFNFLALNLAMLVASLPLVTVPLVINAATVALNRWRDEGEDRVVREFVSALRSSPQLRTTLAVGAPLAVACVALEEVHYFVLGGDPVGWICLGFGVSALLIALTSIGYVVLIESRHGALSVSDLWSVSVRLALQNFFVTGPLFVAEFVAAVLLGLADPALVLIGLPLAFVFLVRLTANYGVHRIGFEVSGQD